jgi:hypothetical protein
MFCWPLLFHFLAPLVWSLACFWVAFWCVVERDTGGSTYFAFSCTGVLGCLVAGAVKEIGKRFRQYEDRIQKLEEELERRWQYVP